MAKATKTTPHATTPPTPQALTVRDFKASDIFLLNEVMKKMDMDAIMNETEPRKLSQLILDGFMAAGDSFMKLMGELTGKGDAIKDVPLSDLVNAELSLISSKGFLDFFRVSVLFRK